MVLHDLGVSLLESVPLPEWTPFGIAVVMLAALVLLWFSMRRHLKRADYPDDPATPRTDTPTASPASPSDA